ncbi:MAG: endolytic transglycosylase MltG [Gammaproteobacteria bacterium HGW-Gammaproteobacteria-10]|nr:MAG: endolytic transglycosylase MltG [Gammaproteobacteria bacterium HGW-Gammaproteobacteria-10]
MLNKLVGISIVLTSFLLGWLWIDYQHFVATPLADKPVYIEINKGDSFGRITEKLKEQELAVKPLWLKLLALQTHYAGRLKAGDYEIAQGATAFDILSLFASGKSRQYAITFPEGWNFNQFLEQINSHPNIQKTLDKSDSEALLSYLNSDYDHPEGLFFPDTYFFDKNTTDLALLKRAHDRMLSILDQEWRQKQDNLPFETPYQALILASIVEKETSVPEERPIIAGVFIRRLEKGMLLQTDPTVIYGMGEDYQGNIRKKDLLTHTPYNTYVISGLPPTPIAMPGQASIHAVLHPEEGESLYFVSKGDGTHAFSANLAEHNQAVTTYQLKQ